MKYRHSLQFEIEMSNFHENEPFLFSPFKAKAFYFPLGEIFFSLSFSPHSDGCAKGGVRPLVRHKRHDGKMRERGGETFLFFSFVFATRKSWQPRHKRELHGNVTWGLLLRTHIRELFFGHFVYKEATLKKWLYINESFRLPKLTLTKHFPCQTTMIIRSSN